MNPRVRKNPATTLTAIALIAILGFFSTHCQKFEPERKIIVKTTSFTNVSLHSCKLTGTLYDLGENGVSEHGFYLSLTPDITEASPPIKLGEAKQKGQFQVTAGDLTPGTTYYVWAFASKGNEKDNGDPITFTTLSATPPELSTHAVIEITWNSAVSGGTINFDGHGEVIEKGICWSLSSQPTTADFKLNSYSSELSFALTMNDLQPETEYFVRAFARNNAEIGYGDPIGFRTLFSCGSQLVDERDGQTYFTVQIGEQCWMAENLNAGKLVDISAGQFDNGSLEKYCYADDQANCDQYGAQYTWDEMMQYTMIESSQGICPAGWHIPSDFEWKIMERSLGMSVEESDAGGWRGTYEGDMLKAAGQDIWVPDDVNATNSSLFSALPAGMIWEDGSSNGIGFFAVFWTSTPVLDTQAWYRYLETGQSQISRADGIRPNTTSVRCIKD